MRGERLHQAKRAAQDLVNAIAEHYSFAVIAFDEKPWLVYESVGEANRRSTSADRAAAVTAIDKLVTGKGTNFAAALRYTRYFFAASHATEGHALLLSDGEDQHPNTLFGELAKYRRDRKRGFILSVGCVRIGEGTRIEYLREICNYTFGGVVQVVESLAELADYFSNWFSAIDAANINNLRLVVRTRVPLVQLVQVAPSVIPLTENLCESEEGLVLPLGSIGSRPRDFYVELQLPDGVAEDNSVPLAEVWVRYSLNGREYAAPASWARVCPVSVCPKFTAQINEVRQPEKVEASLDCIAWAEAVNAGLTACLAGDLEAGLNHFREAVRLARKWDRAELLALLERILEIGDDGSIRLKSQLEIERNSMPLDAAGTEAAFSETDPVRRPPRRPGDSAGQTEKG
jgi:hypothetical protein